MPLTLRRPGAPSAPAHLRARHRAGEQRPLVELEQALRGYRGLAADPLVAADPALRVRVGELVAALEARLTARSRPPRDPSAPRAAAVLTPASGKSPP